MAARPATAAQKAQRELEDLQLVMRARNGDGGALDTLIRRYNGFVRLKASSYFLAGRGVAERDIGVQGRVLEAGRGLDGGDDLTGHAQLREAPKRGLLVGAEVPNRLVKPDQAFLDEVLGVPAGEEVGAGLEPNEAVVAPDQGVERPAVTVPGAHHKLEVFELPLGLLRSGCGPCGHLASPGVRGETFEVSP